VFCILRLCFFMLDFVSSVLVKRLAGKSISEMTYFVSSDHKTSTLFFCSIYFVFLVIDCQENTIANFTALIFALVVKCYNEYVLCISAVVSGSAAEPW